MFFAIFRPLLASCPTARGGRGGRGLRRRGVPVPAQGRAAESDTCPQPPTASTASGRSGRSREPAGAPRARTPRRGRHAGDAEAETVPAPRQTGDHLQAARKRTCGGLQTGHGRRLDRGPAGGLGPAPLAGWTSPHHPGPARTAESSTRRPGSHSPAGPAAKAGGETPAQAPSFPPTGATHRPLPRAQTDGSAADGTCPVPFPLKAVAGLPIPACPGLSVCTPAIGTAAPEALGLV